VKRPARTADEAGYLRERFAVKARRGLWVEGPKRNKWSYLPKPKPRVQAPLLQVALIV
jgi:hypothetical protein